LPSALLERRPDIRQAEQTLVAANARIGVAKAEYFPKITLTGVLGVESVALSDLFTGGSRFWSIGPAMTVPLFTAGRTRNTVKGFEARQQQAATRYLQTIQQAFREVEDALVFHRKVREVRTERERRVVANRRALSLVTLRYERGLSSQLEVLDIQRELFSAELELASATRDQLTAVVQLYRALGGGWQGQPALASTVSHETKARLLDASLPARNGLAGGTIQDRPPDGLRRLADEVEKRIDLNGKGARYVRQSGAADSARGDRDGRIGRDRTGDRAGA
jgi:multidrug efflux system outer membrane protein